MIFGPTSRKTLFQLLARVLTVGVVSILTASYPTASQGDEDPKGPLLTVPGQSVKDNLSQPNAVDDPGKALATDRGNAETPAKQSPSSDAAIEPDTASEPDTVAEDAAMPTDAEMGDRLSTDAEEPSAIDGDDNSPEIETPAAVVAEPETVGEPLAGSIITLLQKEIVNGVKRRRIQDQFRQFQSYLGNRMDVSRGAYTGSELAGNCRLAWYDHLMRNPVLAPAEAEAFTRQLHEDARCADRGLAELLLMAGYRLDLLATPEATLELPHPKTPDEALEIVRQSLVGAQLKFGDALAPLTKSQISDLARNLYPILTSQNEVGHTLQSRGTGRRLCDLLEKMDRRSMLAAAITLSPLSTPDLLEQLKALPDDVDSDLTISGVTGPLVARLGTAAGTILIGGKGSNTYQLDQLPDVNVVIDLGGDDIYYDGSVTLQRPVLVVIDLAGNDGYRSEKPGVQGSAILGVSMLVDYDGDDVYFAKDVAQGSAIGGVGILIDYAGKDAYVGLRRVQGQALGGVGLLVDRGGADRYHAALWAQGMGGPLGFGLLDDLDGNDHYYAGGLYLNSYLDDDNPTPGYEGWGQGMGGGLRAVANGGIGVILDGGGDDVYEFDYLSHGGGYWCGVGFARDFGGNDHRLGATRKAYKGGPRTQRSFQRFGSGFGCHYSIGFLFDDRGNDTYNGTIMCLGYAWDASVGYLFDFAGDDVYNGNEGNGAQAGLGVLFDYVGDDEYKGYRQGRASSGISYHDMPTCGGNFSFVADYGGTDKYGCGARNNSYLQRGSSGGFLIDRPQQEEENSTAESPQTRKIAGAGS